MSENIEQKANELLNLLETSYDGSSLIQDNKILFSVENKLYRCFMPNQKEKTLAEDQKNRLYNKLIKTGEFLTRNQVKKILKEKQDIDLDALQDEKLRIQKEIQDLYLTLAPILTENNPDISKVKYQIEEKKLKYFEVLVEVQNHLSHSIENRLDKEYVEYLAFMCTELNIEGENWEKVWKSYNDFQLDNSKVANKSVEYLTTLLVNTRD